MERDRAVRISKILALALRHDPSALGLALDGAGWAAVDDVLAGLAARGEALSAAELEEIVATSDKQRYALSPDGARIRANQGHSVDVDLGLAPARPPEILFHGTVDRFVDAILREGLRRGARTHVHLSADERTAAIVGARRAGPTVILRVRAGAMHEDGLVLFRSDNGVWLTEHVPPRYLER